MFGADVLVRDGRAAARAWVAEYAVQGSDFRGAFFSGSTTVLPENTVLPAWSDVDVVVVVAGSTAPPKLGKFAYRGVVLDVTYLLWTELANPTAVARSYYLAPSFASNQVIVDPTGHLGLLRAEVSPRFHYPVTVQRRYEDVLSKIETRLLALDPTAAWHDQVTAWLFPTSLTTQVVLVAALRNPTVRLRYLAARTVLHCHDQDAFYPVLLGLLGCAGRDRHIVQHHLDRLAITFDQAAAVSRTPFFFSTDITQAARPIAIDGSQDLIDNGDHREAAELRFRAAVTDLLGIRDTSGLLARRKAVRELLPALQESAASIARTA